MQGAEELVESRVALGHTGFHVPGYKVPVAALNGLVRMDAVLRQAQREDIAAMHRVRLAVRENRLTSAAISEAHYVPAIEQWGRGWVIERQGQIVAFAVGNAQNGNVWALFVDPAHERRGYGKRLHETMVQWLWSQGLSRLWLTTESGTRAQRFYASAGWQRVGEATGGEVQYELRRA